MTDIDEYSEPTDISLHEANPWPAQPLPVVNATEETAPEFGSCMTWPVGQAGIATSSTRLLPRRLRRHKGKMTVASVTGATSLILNSNQNSLDGNPNAPQGATYIVVAGTVLPEWESQQPLYAIAIGGTLTVSVIDESYGSR